MEHRVNPYKASPKAYQALLSLQQYVNSCGLEKPLMELVKTRTSQINGCAFCLDMHTKDARAAGETEQRLYLLNAWREASLYSERERAALEWTEAITRIPQDDVSDELFQRARAQFSDEELANLSLAIVTINCWNRLNVAFRVPAGNYRPAAAHAD